MNVPIELPVPSDIVLPLSPVHGMLPRIGREYHAHRLNRIVNDPSVYPWVKGFQRGRLDASPLVANPANILLMGEHGGVLFIELMPGLYEAHTQILPSGRGAWGLLAVRAMLHWMFTRTEAIEIVTRCPHGNIPALALAKRIGGRFWFTNQLGWVKDNDPIPADIYRLTIQDWLEIAPGLPERGHWFHEKLEAEYRRLGKPDPSPHPDDDTHDRYAGYAAECFIGGQPQKGVIFYNRWASMAGYLPVSVLSFDPLTVNIQDALIVVREGGDFWVAAVTGTEQ